MKRKIIGYDKALELLNSGSLLKRGTDTWIDSYTVNYKAFDKLFDNRQIKLIKHELFVDTYAIK